MSPELHLVNVNLINCQSSKKIVMFIRRKCLGWVNRILIGTQPRPGVYAKKILFWLLISGFRAKNWLLIARCVLIRLVRSWYCAKNGSFVMYPVRRPSRFVALPHQVVVHFHIFGTQKNKERERTGRWAYFGTEATQGGYILPAGTFGWISYAKISCSCVPNEDELCALCGWFA